MAYAPVNGLRLYYEIRGTGRPLVLLHGGLMTIDLNFGPLLEPLARGRQVIAVELQGHGHTADTGRAMTRPDDHLGRREPARRAGGPDPRTDRRPYRLAGRPHQPAP